jgi:ferredoxin
VLSIGGDRQGPGLMGERLAIDRIRCDGYGMCAEMFPEGIELDDWGYPILRAGAIPDRLLRLARRAIDVCPVLALRLVDAPSEQPSSTIGRRRPVGSVSRS